MKGERQASEHDDLHSQLRSGSWKAETEIHRASIDGRIHRFLLVVQKGDIV